MVDRHLFVIGSADLNLLGDHLVKSSDFGMFVDVDDTLIRSFGTKRIPITIVIQHLRKLHQDGVKLFLWSSAGADYARASARELGIEPVFESFLPKPNVILDDQPVVDWLRTITVHPNESYGLESNDYVSLIESKATARDP